MVTKSEPSIITFEKSRSEKTKPDLFNKVNALAIPIRHLFEDLDTGERKCLNGAGQLNYCMEQLSEGDVCKIVFKGKVMLETGKMAGKEANQFDVFVEDSAPVKKVEDVASDLDGLE